MKMQEIHEIEQIQIATLSMLATKVNFVLLQHRKNSSIQCTSNLKHRL